MRALLIELREAARQIRRSATFSMLAVGLLAVGLGATVTIFSILHSIVLQPLPFFDPGRLIGVQAMNPSKSITQDWISVTDFRDFAARTRTLASAGAVRPNFASFTRHGEPPLRLVTGLVTPGLIETLGVAPALGRTFIAEDFSTSSERTVILSHSAWQRYFHGNPAALGMSMMLDDEACTIIGVMPETFREPVYVDAWLPFPKDSPEYFARDSRFWTMIGRLAPGIDAHSAAAELATFAADLAREYPDTNRDWTVAVVPLQELRTRDLRGALLLLCGAVGLVLLVACLNLANLLLARGVARLPELGVRIALGATPRRLALRVVIESQLLAVAGAFIGCVMAAGLLKVMAARVTPEFLPRAHEIALHVPALVVAFALALACGGVCALLPALHLLRLDVNALLKEGATRGATGGRSARTQAALVAGQVALTVAVLAGALLMMKSLVRLQNVPPGFDPEGLVTLRLSPPPSRYETTAELARYYEDLLDAADDVPGVQSVAVNASSPLSGISLAYPTWTYGSARDAGSAHQAVYAPVSERFFETARIPLRSGRTYTEHDGAESAPVVVVNEAYARRVFPDGRALGRRILLLPWMGETYREIVGIVGDTRQDNLAAPPPPQVYVPQRQMPWFFSTLLVRLEQPGVMPALREALHRVDPSLPFTPTVLVDDIAGTTTQPRLYAALFSGFALVALALSGFGIYASLRFTLSQRIREVGVRIALGATPTTVMRWVLGHMGRMVAIGTAVGVAVALPLGAALRSQLYGVGAFDPTTFAALPAFVGLVALVASLPTAIRAARLPPAIALQHE